MGQIFSATIIRENNIRFNTEISIEEDTLFSFEFDNYIQKPSIHYEEIIYFYRANPTGLLHTNNYDRSIRSNINLASALYEHRKNEIGNKLYAEFKIVLSVCKAIMQIVNLDRKERKKYLKLLKSKGIEHYKPSRAAIDKFKTKNTNINIDFYKAANTRYGYYIIFWRTRLKKVFSNISEALHLKR